LDVIEVNVPPLRKRKDDIPLLIEHFITKYNKQLNKNFKYVDNAVMRALMSYDWPGNVRELENFIERSMILGEGEFITLQDLPAHLTGEYKIPQPFYSLKEAVSFYEREHIIRTLKNTQGDKKQAAEILDIGLSSLYRKIEKFGISMDERNSQK